MATVEETKPAVSTEAGVVEPTPAPAETLTADKPAEAVEPKVEEPVKAEGEPVAATEEKKEEEKVAEKVEPIYTGALGYKAPGLKNAFRYSKKYFWFSEEPVSVQSLSHYLRGEKAEVAHPTAAWSSQTGKGLLFFVKHADQKETPAGVLNLSDATDLSKDGITTFHLKIQGHKHSFESSTTAERNGWFVAFEKAIEEAKGAKESIVSSEGYKEQLDKLGKPAALAAAVAKDSTPKKSTDATKAAEPETAAPTEAAAPVTAPIRTGSASSASADEEKRKQSSKSKSRSVSRGKRASLFGGFFGNKEKTEEKKEEKKEEEAEAKAEEGAPATVTEASTTAPVIPVEIPAAAEELKTETPIPAAEPIAEAPKEETKAVEEKPKPTKRGSIFGSFAQKLKSPTAEKKESDVVPAPPAKESEIAAEAPKIEETPAIAPLTDGTVDAPAEEKKEEAKPPVSTPHKEKQHFSFGKFLGGAKEKVKSPTTEKSPIEAAKTEEPAKAEETPASAAPVDPIAEAPKEEKKEEEAAVGEPTTATAPPAAKPKRGSIFGNLTGSVKKEKDGETSEKPKGLSGLFRQASKAGKSKKEKEPAAAPTKVEETAEPKEEKVEETPVLTEPNTIGDVVPDAVTVGQAPKSTPEVSATA